MLFFLVVVVRSVRVDGGDVIAVNRGKVRAIDCHRGVKSDNGWW